MDYEELGKNSYAYLKEKAEEIGIPIKKKKSDILNDLTVLFKEHEARKIAKRKSNNSSSESDLTKKSTLKKSTNSTTNSTTSQKSVGKPTLIVAGRYIREEEFRPKTKDTWMYYAKDTKNGNKCIMKCFRCDKASSAINREIEMHTAAQRKRIAPNILYYDQSTNKILYEQADKTLEKYLNEGNILNRDQQNRMLVIMRTLDELGILYADPHPRNFIIKNNTINTIEYTNSKKIDTKIIKTLETSTPNRDLLLYKFVQYLKVMKVDSKSYCILEKLFSN